MAQDKYKPQLRLIKGGKLTTREEPKGEKVREVEIPHGKEEETFEKMLRRLVAEDAQSILAGLEELKKLSVEETKAFASDEEEAEWYRERAEQGDPNAQNHLGDMYDEGRGVPEDRAQAEEWWRKAEKGYRPRAKKGDANAQYHLGELYYYGAGVRQNYKQAADWLRKAADQNHSDAQYLLGEMYYNGDGLPEDEKQAAKWYRKAAEQGHVGAQYDLGMMYNRGRGVPKDIDQAEEWLGKVADTYCERAKLGDADALGRLRQLAKGRWTNAQYLLGVLYETGNGVMRKNWRDAAAWYRKAAEQGHEKAKAALVRLNS